MLLSSTKERRPLEKNSSMGLIQLHFEVSRFLQFLLGSLGPYLNASYTLRTLIAPSWLPLYEKSKGVHKGSYGGITRPK